VRLIREHFPDKVIHAVKRSLLGCSKLLCGIAALALTLCAQLYSQTGMLFGKDHAFYFTAPSGWVLDNKSGVGQGVHMAFYPAGSTYQNSPVFAYGRSASLTGEIKTVEDLVKSTIREFKNNGSVNYSGRKERTIELPGGKTAEIYFYRGDRWGNYEAAGYILERKTINFLVFNCRYKKAFDDNIEKFYEILKTYKNAFQEPVPGFDEKVFREFVNRAEIDKRTDQGKAYEELLTSTQAKDLEKLCRECLAYEKEASGVGDFEAVFLIEPNGNIRESYVWPVNSLSNCFKGAAASLEIPPHQLPLFHWHVSFKINDERGADNAAGINQSRATLDPSGQQEGSRFLRIGNLPPNIFLVRGSYNPYEYWRGFKPGSTVTFRIYSEVAGKRTLSRKKFEIKAIASDKISVLVKGDFDIDKALSPDVEFVQMDNSTMILGADTPPWESNDLFDGYLSLNFSDTKLFLDADEISVGKETLDIGGQTIKTDSYTLTFKYPQVTTTITIWYADDIPGGVARYKREIRAAGTSTLEEIAVEEFHSLRMSENEYQNPSLATRKEIPGSTYLGKRLHFFEDEQVVEIGWRMIAKTLKEKNAELLLPEINALFDDANRWKGRFEEDQRHLITELSEQDRGKLQPFFKQAAQYCQSMLDYIATERDFLLKFFNEPETIDQNFMQRVEDFKKNNNPWAELRNQYIAARNGLKDINIHLLER
jgi:hypothetical protein